MILVKMLMAMNLWLTTGTCLKRPPHSKGAIAAALERTVRMKG